MTLFGENTEAGRKKFKEDLEQIHENFKHHVQSYRPQLDLNKVATGEHWLARDAMHLGLVDELQTSDDFLIDNLNKYQIIILKQSKTQSLLEKLTKGSQSMLQNIKQYLKITV